MRSQTCTAAVLVITAAWSSGAAAAPQCGNTTDNTAYTGADVGYALVADAGACCSVCNATFLCAAYTWTPDAATGGGRCFLKTAALDPKALPGAVSGTLSGASESACPFGLVPCTSGPSKGACALFADWCLTSSCAVGTAICPDGRACGSNSSSSTGWAGCPSSSVPAYLNTSMPTLDRLAALVPQLSIDEIAPQLNNPGYGVGPPGPPGIERLAVPPYNWLNEGLHGFARAGLATSFPQISVVGQTWNRTVWGAMGRVLGLEARAKYAMDRRGNSTGGDYTGVTLYAPNLNLGRDPRWGRLQEVVSEDPYLTAQYGDAAVRAAQAPLEGDPLATTPKIYACCKHAVGYSFEHYNGIERAAQNAIISGHDLLDSYLPAFQACIRDAGGKSVMASYNAVNGVPTVASAFLLNTTIRGRYGFSGSSWVMSDYSAIADTYTSHKYCGSAPGANDTCTALAMQAGCDQDGGGNDYQQVARLMREGLLTEGTVRTAAGRLFQARLELGLLDPPEAAPYTHMTPQHWLDTDAHRALSYEAAQQGMVLLKNDQLSSRPGSPVLPLDAALFAGATVAVVGPNADAPGTLVGNYNGTTPYLITPRMGLQALLGPLGATISYAKGCSSGVSCNSTDGFAAALSLATSPSTKLVVGVFGIDQSVEAEGLDRASLDMPGYQLQLISELAAAAAARGVPFVLALINGGPLDVSMPLASPAVPAMLLVGYASQSAGTAMADILFGRYAPAGKLAVTWWRNASTDLPDFADMGMLPNATTGNLGRTYRYNEVVPLLPFGFGLTYTNWSYSLNVAPPATPCGNTTLTVDIVNIGAVDSSEVVQVYILLSANEDYPAPRVALMEFEREWVPAKSGSQLTFTLPPRALARVNASAAASFGQDFAMTRTRHDDALSGRAFGLTRDYHAEAAAAGAGPIGWDDMFAIVPGTASVWVGSGQPGTGVAGAQASFVIPGSTITNLAQCAIDAAAAAAVGQARTRYN